MQAERMVKSLLDVYMQYVTANEMDENGGLRCFSCGEDCSEDCDRTMCRKVQRALQTCLNTHQTKRFPNFEIVNTLCGEDGIARILEKGNEKCVIKAVLCLNTEAHAQRYHVWNLAADANVGPKVFYGEFCYLSKLYFGISLISMSFWPQCTNNADNAMKIMKLVQHTSNSNLFHTDAHRGNIHCDSESAIFIDWENAILCADEERDVVEYLMLCRLFVDSDASSGAIFKTRLQILETANVDTSTFIQTIKDPHVVQSVENLLAEYAMLKSKTSLHEMYSKQHPRSPLMPIRGP